jgi:hypothetical protein
VSKLFGYDFAVEYWQGKFNVVVDAVSRCNEDSMEVHALSSPSFVLYDQLRDELATLPQPSKLRAQIAEGSADGWSDIDDLLMFQGHIFLPDDSTLWSVVLQHAHMMDHMKGVRKHYINFERCSIARMCAITFENMYTTTMFVNAIRHSIFIRQVYYNLFLFLIKFGVILLWISLKLFQKLVGNHSS